VRRAAVEAVGAFDEGYFMYVEEVDWCYRLKRAGWQVWHCPDALAVHHGGRSTVQARGGHARRAAPQPLALYRKYYSAPFRVGARALTGAGMLAGGAAGGPAGALRPGQPARHAEARACLEVLRL
jgi:GT2 family glycosyltransferase